jgi:hypothetical protein
MRFVVYGSVVACLLIGAAACSRPASQDQAQQATKDAAKGVAEGAQDAAKGFEAMAKGMQEMAANANTKPVEPVSFRDLQAAFPDLAGWDKGKPTGEKMTSPVSYSEARVSYSKGDSSINAKIVDSGFNQMLVAPFAMFLTTGYEKETEDGYEKAVKVGEYPGWERWNSEGKSGELNAIVGKRFVVTFEGSGLESTKPLYELAQQTDLGKLASMK